MKKYRRKKGFRALAAVLGLSLVWGSAAPAEPSADSGAKVEVDIVQNGELVSAQTDRIDNMLYSVIELDKPVELEEGEYFSVVQTMRLLTPGSETFLIPL